MEGISIGEFLTPEQGSEAVRLWVRHGDTRQFITAVTARVIRPNLAEINRKLGKEHDPRALAAVIHARFVQTGQ